jgi:hypothetical protein
MLYFRPHKRRRLDLRRSRLRFTQNFVTQDLPLWLKPGVAAARYSIGQKGEIVPGFGRDRGIGKRPQAADWRIVGFRPWNPVSQW